MKKIIIFFTFIILINLPVYSFDCSNIQIRKTLRNYNKALKNHDIEKVKSFYDKDYKNSDGFSLDELMEMLEKSHNTYDDLTYKTKVNSISIFDDYAVVQITDTTKATVHLDKNKSAKKAGKLKGKSVDTVYFKKHQDGWKIVFDDVLVEQTSLKYGIANKIKMDLKTPPLIEKGQEYDVSLKMDKPDNIIALASIANEEIKYPTPDYQEKFRKFPSNGDLERIVRANKNNLDEYAIASVGFTKITLNEEETRARVEILGMAYLIKRINMKHIKGANAQ